MSLRLLFLYVTCLNYIFLNSLVNYNLHQLKDAPIDVVILLHEKDKNKIDLTISAIRKFGKNIRRIITVSEKRLTNKAEWFDEKKFPFYKTDIANEIFPNDKNAADALAKHSRLGWIMKQLFNLYAAFVIPGISPNILALDGDTMFLKPVEFIDAQGNALYNPGFHIYEPYFEHAAKLIAAPNQIRKVEEFNGEKHPEWCGVSHHMLFQRPVLEDLFNLIRQTHNIEPWKAICKCFDRSEVYKSVMAEYEIYFNFVFARSNQVKTRLLKFKDIAFKKDQINKYKKEGYDYVSCHHYIEY